MKRSTGWKGAALTLIAACLACGAASGQTAIPSIFALPSGTADATKPGFVWRIHEVTTGQPPDNARTEAQLAGLLGVNVADPNAQGAASGPASPANPTTTPLTFAIPGVVNMSVGYGGYAGNFTPDDPVPGLPGLTGSYENAAADLLTWLDLPAGTITLGVNSDDGFRMTLGGANPSDQFAVKVGEFNGGRAASDTFFSFTIAHAGLYAARCTWENACCGASLEIFSVNSSGSEVLLNDTANGGIRAYRAVTIPARAYAQKVTPSPGGAARADASIIVELVDAGNAIDPATIKLSLDGTQITPIKSKSGNVTTTSYTRPSLHAAGLHNVAFTYTEAGSPVTVNWTFTVLDYQGPNGNLYEFVQAANIPWLDAKVAAEQRSFGCVHGHLVTLTSAEEDQFVEFLRQEYVQAGALRAGEVWAGGYQLPNQATPNDGWFWINNEGPIPGYNGGNIYANWNQASGDPNDCCNTYGIEDNEENYLGLGYWGPGAGWIDDDASHGNIVGYVVEYEAQVVTVDIQSGGSGNAIDLSSNGKIHVEIQSSPTFDASTVDPATVTVGATGTEAAPEQSTLTHARTVLLCQFSIQDLGLTCSNNTLLLKAKTFPGCPVRGTVSVTPKCPPYVLSMVGMQDVHKLTDVYLTIGVVVNNCVAPSVSQHIQLKSLDLLDHTRWTANSQNVPLTPSANNSSTGDLQYSNLHHHQQIQAQVQVQSCQANNTLVLRQQGVVLLRPDVAVTSIDAPQSVFAGGIVNVGVLLNELNGDLGTTGTVYLLEGAKVLDQVTGSIGPRGAISVVFSTMFSTLGTHQLQVIVANESPGDYDPSNNQKSFSIQVAAQPAYQYTYYSHTMDEYAEDYNYPWWQSGTNYLKENVESLSEYLYAPATLTFPLASVTIATLADGYPKDTFILSSLAADSYTPAPYYYAQAYRHLADGFDFYVYTYNYPGYQQFYAQIYRSAADSVYYSAYHNYYWGDGASSYNNRYGTFLNASTSVATAFVVKDNGGVAYGGTVIIPLSAYSWNNPFDSEDATSGYYDRGYSSGTTVSGSSSGYVSP